MVRVGREVDASRVEELLPFLVGEGGECDAGSGRGSGSGGSGSGRRADEGLCGDRSRGSELRGASFGRERVRGGREVVELVGR